MKNRRTHRLRFLSSWAPFLLGVIGFAACTQVTATSTFPTQTAASITGTSTALPLSSPTSIPTRARTALKVPPQVVVLAANLPEPDDLLLASDGSILISDVKDGTIKQYGLDGQMHLVLSGLNEPEGMALAPDGSLIIAEQGNNRLVRYDFASKTLRPFLNLVNHTHNLGVDNILRSGASLIVPDSPNGTVLDVSLDGNTVRRLASGLVRPTGAWVEADGNILLADEYGNAVVRLHPDGTLEKVVELSIPDDVIADTSGNIFAITLGDGAVHMIPAGQSRDVVLVGGLSSPQGMIFDLDGNLIVTDPGHHELIKVVIH
ncbi:MAG TPA: hypothetical protein VF784_02050 [Anaerolineales bacterium]